MVYNLSVQDTLKGNHVMAGEKKRVALVTGSTRGIGRGIALHLAQQGFDLIINGVQRDPSSKHSNAFKVKALAEKNGIRAEVCIADISSADDREHLLSFVENQFGRLDMLVNNAGIEPEMLDMLESDQQRFHRVMGINLEGPYFLTQQVAKRMIHWTEKGIIERGRIAFVTSVQGHMTNPKGAEYCLSKAALGMTVKLFAHRLGEYGIPVIEVRPGIVESDMSLVHRDSIDRMIASGRLVTPQWGKPRDVARIITAFAHGDFDYSTGQTIEVDGGLGLNRL